jgi:hypothetical protein
MDNVATATTLAVGEHRAAVVNEVLRTQYVNSATAPACIKPIILENGLQEVTWMGTSYLLQLDSDGRPLNPFYFLEMADRYKFWWKHLVLWAEAIIGDRTRNCNATSEVVNLVLKGNTMHGKCFYFPITTYCLLHMIHVFEQCFPTCFITALGSILYNYLFF